MKRMWMIVLAMTAITSSGAGGCDDNERLADYAHNSVEQQSRQNEQIARQNLEVSRQNRHVAEAAQNLVEADAKARQEMVFAQKALQAGLQAERSTLDRQRQEIDQERKEIALDRYWEPLVAESIAGCGALLACLLPLVICIYVLRNMQHDRSDEAALNELLVSELTVARPRLLSPPAEIVPALKHDLLPDDPDGSEAAANGSVSGS